MSAHHRFEQFGVACAFLKRMAFDVIAKFELRIILQGRMCEVEGCENQTLPVARQKVDATLEMRYQDVEFDLAFKGLKDTNVERTVVRFGV